MQRSATVPTIVLTLGLGLVTATWSAESSAKEPEKGSVVYVSRVLQPDSGQPQASKNAAHPGNTGLAACEPVEVQAVHGKSLKVLWKKDGKTHSTLGEHWDAVVHATRKDCLKVMESRNKAH
jgi:hypothetical protein